MNCLLKIDSLSFSYPGQVMFEGLSLQLNSSQVVGLLGANGEGKSTLLKLLAGVLPKSAGVLKVCDSEIAPNALTIGYMPERPLFYPELSVQDNVSFVARLHKVDSFELQQRVAEIIDRCQLSEKKRTLAGTLSKGYQQRLGLAMAIVHKPLLILLDEPIDGMDPGQVRETHALIRELSEHSSLLISSQRVFEMTDVCDRVLFLKNGKIIQDRLTDGEISHQELSDLFDNLQVDS